MRFGKRITSILLSPYFLALIISSVIFLFIPTYNQEYDFEIIEIDELGPEYMVYFRDLDNDGYSEKVFLKHYQSIPIVEVYNNDQSFYNYWTQDGIRACHSDIMFGDTDADGFLELYVFTEEKDSVYINQIEPFDNNSKGPIKKAICKINKVDDRCDYLIKEGGMADLNNDGYKEVVFFISTGYGLSPRNLFAVDFRNNSIKRSPKSYASIRSSVVIIDIDNDGKKEITYKTGAVANVKGGRDVAFTDHSAWLMVHDSELNFKFPPIEFPGDQKSVQSVPHRIGDTFYIFAAVFDARAAKNPQQLLVYSVKGELVKDIDISAISSKYGYISLFNAVNDQDNLLYIITQNGNIYRVNDDFSFGEIASLNGRISPIFVDDFNEDGTDEFIFYEYGSENICLSDMNLQNLSRVSIEPNLAGFVLHVGVFQGPNEYPEIYGQFGQTLIQLALIKVPFYYNVLLFAAIYIAVGIVVFVAQKIQIVQLNRNKRAEERIGELQLQSTLSQLDPHFAFNVINSISTSILLDKKETANEYLVKFSRMLRKSLEYSDKLSWPIEREIEFVKDFLNLQKARFSQVFDYELFIEKNINLSVQIPKMIVQGYVDNAIKHGLRPKGADGLLRIYLKQQNKKIQIIIEDNGIGRSASFNNRTNVGIGKGMKLNEELIDLYRKLKNINIQIMVDDKVDARGNPAGTRVVVIIPT